MGLLSKKNKPSQKAYAVVTGAGSGIGRSFALELAKRGGDVQLTADLQAELDAIEYGAGGPGVVGHPRHRQHGRDRLRRHDLGHARGRRAEVTGQAVDQTAQPADSGLDAVHQRRGPGEHRLEHHEQQGEQDHQPGDRMQQHPVDPPGQGVRPLGWLHAGLHDPLGLAGGVAQRIRVRRLPGVVVGRLGLSEQRSGQPGDAQTDPTLPWPAERRLIKAGTLTINTAMAQKFARRLHGRFNLPVHTHDERLTTFEAKGERMARGGQRGSYRDNPVDAIAAALLLQGWLEANT